MITHGASSSPFPLDSFRAKMSSMPIMIRTSPPATRKLSIEIPNRSIIGSPMKMNVNSRMPATSIARLQ